MTTTLKDLSSKFNQTKYRKLNQEMSFEEYLDLVKSKPQLAYSSYQRLYAMIASFGTEKVVKYRKTVKHYKFFDDKEIPIFGLEGTINSMMKHIKGAANYFGAEKRLMLLSGPVGSSKSTICRLLKKGLERYSQTEEGAIYSYKWKNLGKLDISESDINCPMNDDPLKLIPMEMRADFLTELQERLEQQTPENKQNEVFPLKIIGNINPQCKYYFDKLMEQYDGDWMQVMQKHIVVRRIVLSEANRCGIGTFQPKDPKNQDSTELTGDTNFLKLGYYGVDSDPRAFSFDGEFEIANRGMLEFIEIFKLDKEFLYDLLGVCQERQFKPKKFSQIDVDMVLIGHSNIPELEKIKQDKTMEAIRDRTVKIDVPYLREWDKELAVLKQDYSKQNVRIHVAPHTLDIASLFAVISRFKRDGTNNISPVEKAKLYNGKTMPNYTEENVKEMWEKHPDEGLVDGVSARFVQNAISNSLVTGNKDYINPFDVLNELKEKIYTLLNCNDEELRSYYLKCIVEVRKELEERLENEVQEAMVGDADVIVRLYESYIDNVNAFINKSKVNNPMTGEDMEPNERLMREIEDKIDIPDHNAQEFRRQIATHFFSEQQKAKKKGSKDVNVAWDSNPRLAKALKKKLFDDVKDTIQLAKLSSNVSMIDRDLQDKIDSIKARLVKNYGYITESATDVLNYVSTIFARGGSVKD